MKVYSVIIVGAGPSGISCAIQLKRYGIDFLIFEKNKVGGLLLNANLVENYPGFPEGITGQAMVKKLIKHLEVSKIKIKKQEVLECSFHIKKKIFVIKTKKQKYFSKILVIASGTKPRKSDYEGINKISEDKVFYEVYGLRNMKNREIAVVGAGDAAFDYALSLSNKNKVYILNRSKQIKALHLLVKRAEKIKNIKYYKNTVIKKIVQENKKVLIICKRGKNLLKLKTDFILFATGREPNLNFFSQKMKDRLKNLKKTKILYFIGDIKRGIYRQTSIACGDGILCAMKIYEKLRNENNR